MKCQVIDFVGDRLCGHLWHFPAVCLYIEQTACRLIFGTIWHLPAGLCQYFDWHQFNDSWNLLVSLVHNISKTGNFTHSMHVFHVFSVRSRLCVALTGHWMEIDQWMRVGSEKKKKIVDLSSSKLEHLYVIFRSYFFFFSLSRHKRAI